MVEVPLAVSAISCEGCIEWYEAVDESTCLVVFLVWTGNQKGAEIRGSSGQVQRVSQADAGCRCDALGCVVWKVGLGWGEKIKCQVRNKKKGVCDDAVVSLSSQSSSSTNKQASVALG